MAVIPRIVILVALTLRPVLTHSGEIIVDNSPIQTLDNSIVSQLVEIRQIANVNPSTAGGLKTIKFSKGLILESARQFPIIARLLGDRGDDITFRELKDIIDNSGYKDIYLYSIDQVSPEPESGTRLVRSELGLESSDDLWDATVLTNMVATGVIDVENVEYVDYHGKVYETVGFNPNYATKIASIYTTLPLVSFQPVVEVPGELNGLKGDVRQYSVLEQSILANIGQITFGLPIVYNFEERGLSVPQSMLRDFDVYWLDLAVTFRDVNIGDLAEMAINFALPDGGIALELAPLEYGVSISAKQEKQSNAEIGVDIKGAKIGVGEIFQQTVSYTYLKPVIAAFGLRENKFSWTIREEAMRAGSHRFVAVVGVPKESDGVALAMSAHVRLKKSWLGEWYDGEGIAGTDSKVIYVSF